tara:strand:+ start:1183 stop:2346 length:1164 start_codon:yes stop_codon:yes gene_type:complete
MTILTNLRAERANTHKAATNHLDSVEAEGRDMSDVDTATHRQFTADLELIDARIAEFEAVEARNIAAEPARQRYGSSLGTQHADRTWLPSAAEYRAVAEGAGSTGGFFVPDQQSVQFFDRLAARSVVLSAQPMMMDATHDVLRVPKVGASITVEMSEENAQITPNDPTFEQVTLTPRKLTAMTYASNEALDDSQPGLRQVLAADHERSMGLTLDLQFLEGSGTTPNLRGIRNFTGVTATPLATDGATPTLDDIADAIERLETDNAAAAAIFMHPRTWATYRTLVDSQLRYQLQPDPTGESRRQLFGVPVYVSSQISTTETVGTSEDCSWVGVVDMSQIVVARRNEITIEYSRDFRFDFDQTAIRTVSRWDIAPVNEEGIEIITGVRA